tara:strand:+ start:26928 stop:28388 length:1461 start_codon:yes stop_codon:yes gene_type:complete
MNDLDIQHILTRRKLLQLGARGLGALGAASLLEPGLSAAPSPSASGGLTGTLGATHFKPKAKRVIYLFFSGGPSHIDMYDYHPKMREIHGIELPDSIRNGQRITGMTSGQKSFPCVAPMFEFSRHGQNGSWFSEIVPNIASIADEITLVKSVHTEAINHDPAITAINTGVQQPGKPSMGAWLDWGMGSPNKDLPGYVVMISKGRGQSQALYDRLWGSGFLPSKHQGVKFRSAGDPVLYLSNPKGVSRDMRRSMLDGIAKINQAKKVESGDPEIDARIAQYEMAYRMQTSVPDLVDLKDEPQHVLDLYGKDAMRKGSFAHNCLIARRLSERGVPFVQLFHRGWDQHGSLPSKIRQQCEDVDQPAAALVRDLKQRGLLKDTIVICGGEFGRTIYSQGKLTKDNHGRDHHGRSFSMWMAGGGFKAGFEYGKTDDFAYNIVENPVHVNDLNATVLQCLGIDHERFTYKYLGLDQRLTGVEHPKVIPDLIA